MESNKLFCYHLKPFRQPRNSWTITAFCCLMHRKLLTLTRMLCGSSPTAAALLPMHGGCEASGSRLSETASLYLSHIAIKMLWLSGVVSVSKVSFVYGCGFGVVFCYMALCLLAAPTVATLIYTASSLWRMCPALAWRSSFFCITSGLVLQTQSVAR